MPPQLLFDLSGLDLGTRPVFDKEAISRVNPQRYEMQQLDGILWYDPDRSLILGFKDVTDNEFWVRGHIPGRPLMPGVIMIESAAQLLSFFVKQVLKVEGFVGFGGIESAKFRAAVTPPCRLYLLGQIIEKRTRKYTCTTQGLVKGTIVFEAIISGIKM